MSLFNKFALPLGIGTLGFAVAVILQPLGTNDPYGTNPKDIVKNKKYKPEIFSAVYMKMRKGPNDVISFDMQEQFFNLEECGFDKDKPESFSPIVQSIFIYRFRNGNWTSIVGNEIDKSSGEETCMPIPNSKGGYEPSKNMSEFYYSKPIKIYVFIDNPGIEFQTAWPITFNQYSGGALEKEENEWSSFKRDKNDTFFNANVGEKGGFTNSGPTATDSYTANQFLTYDNLYRLKDCWFNWCSAEGREVDPNSWPENPKYRKYAINYNLRVSTGVNNQIIPIAIDPDTGSGTGSPPPAKVQN